MVSNTNNGLMSALDGPWPVKLNDSILLSAATGQAAASAVLRGNANRIVSSGGAAASCILPAMANWDQGASLVFVINDSANSINVFCAPGDTMNGSSNGSLAVAAGAFAVFLFRPPNTSLNQQSVAVNSVADWRGAAIT